MASGRPVVTCNESFEPLFAELGADAPALAFPPGDAAALADRIGGLLDRPVGARAELGERLRAIVLRDHEVDRLMRRLVAEMEAR
jgi:glycosyltransferase involved in cell wall biosynthesis